MTVVTEPEHNGDDVPTGGGSATWGSIGGTLSTQADLQLALNSKQDSGSYILSNDARLTDARPASDVSLWAKELVKPTYTSGEVGASPSGHGHIASEITGVFGISSGGSGQSTQQAAINALTNVAAAGNEQVLTKDTISGNAVFKVIPSGGASTGCIWSCGIPMILPSSGTAGNNGAVSGLTALPQTYANCYLYFKQGVLSTTPATPGYNAGFYYAVMSSVSAGTVYQEMYESGEAVIPVTPTALVSTGVGIYTQTTATDMIAVDIMIPAGSMGKNGVMLVYPVVTRATTAGVKTFKIKLNTDAFMTTSDASMAADMRPLSIRNRGREDRQICHAFCGFATNATTQFTQHTQDTGASVNLQMTLNLGTATDFMVLEAYMIEVQQNS